MTESSSPVLPAEFQLDRHSASKRPDQLVSVLARVLEREFPEVIDRIRISFDADTAVVRVEQRGDGDDTDELDEATVTSVVKVSQGSYDDFITSPWY